MPPHELSPSCHSEYVMNVNEELAVAEANARFYSAMESGDMDVMADLWLHAEWVQCVHPGWELIVGWEAVSDSWRKIFSNSGGMRISARNVRVKVSGTAAWVTCSENLALFMSGTTAPMSAEMVATNLFQLVEGSWLMVHHHSSPTPNATLPVR